MTTHRATVTRTTKETDVRVELVARRHGHRDRRHRAAVLRPHAAAAGHARRLGSRRHVQGRPRGRRASHRRGLWASRSAQALAEALGDKGGIRRFASIVVPLDEAAVEVALDLAGRTFVVHEVAVPAETIGTFDTGLVEDFVRAFAQAAN